MYVPSSGNTSQHPLTFPMESVRYIVYGRVKNDVYAKVTELSERGTTLSWYRAREGGGEI